MTEFELLTKDRQPVTITINDEDPNQVTAELGDLSITWATHEDCNPAEELASLQADMNAAALVLQTAVRRMKLSQSVRQALAVSFALAEGISVTQAWGHLLLSSASLDEIEAEDGKPLRRSVELAREDAHKLVAAQLRAHGWTYAGTTPPSDKYAPGVYLLDLDSGRRIERREGQVKVQDGSERTGFRVDDVEYWADENGEELRAADAAGRWWFPGLSSRRTLPWDPWELESHIAAEQRDAKREH